MNEKELKDIAEKLKALSERLSKLLAENEPVKVSLEDVRKVLADLSRDGHKDEVRAIINEYGASKLSEIPEEYFAEILKKATAIANG